MGKLRFPRYRGILTPSTLWILLMCAALYTPPPRSTSFTTAASMLHFCASSFCVSFFSHRAVRTASDVTLLTYFVFFTSSSDAALYTPTLASEDVVVAAGLFMGAFAVFGRLLNVTVVQSWQSGTVESLLSYLDIPNTQLRDIRRNYVQHIHNLCLCCFIQKKCFCWCK